MKKNSFYQHLSLPYSVVPHVRLCRSNGDTDRTAIDRKDCNCRKTGDHFNRQDCRGLHEWLQGVDHRR